MIAFKDIELKDKALITSFTLHSKRRNCDLSFSNLCSWRFLYNTQFAVLDGYLLLKFWAEGELVYMMPIGEGNLNKVLEAMIQDAHDERAPFCLLGICTDMCAELEAFMPGRFQFTADRDYADYLYLRTDLATLAGKSCNPNVIMSTSLSVPTPTTNIRPSRPTAFKNALNWKPSGVKPTIATSTKERATNDGHWSTHCTTSMN